MAIDVFVSYHTATSLDTAKAVVQKLESQGLRCWYQDRDSHGSFGGVIRRAIEECRAFVVILNGQSAHSPHVLNEVALAFGGRVEILPIRMTQESLGDDMEYYLTRFNQIDGHSRSWDAALEDLCRHTLRALGRTETQVETIRYDDGRVYVGHVVNGKHHGKGKLTWPSGDTYEGDFVNDIIQGKGKYTFASGTVFEGEWRDGKRTGWGKFHWTNGDIYEGNFVNDIIHGKGTWGQAAAGDSL